mgnify:FL=1
MIASLPMYQRPELDQAHDDFWQLIASKLGFDFPLSKEGHETDLWLNPELLLSQTCGMPYRLDLHDKVTLIGTPDYGIKGCPPGYYRSAVVIRHNDPRRVKSEFKNSLFAFNGKNSQSGYAAAFFDCQKDDFFFENTVCSGSHLNSARMVASGNADIACIDPVSLSYMEEFDNFYNELQILNWTDPTPGLPYISANGADQEKIFNAVSSATSELPGQTPDLLRLKGITYIPKEIYLAVPNPQAIY